jgi:hypothetical protein
MAAPRYPSEWYELNGVSLGIPQWAGILALVNQERVSLGELDLSNEGVMDGFYLAGGSNENGSGKIN